MKNTLIASSGSLVRIKELTCKYFHTSSLIFKTDNKITTIENSDGILQNFVIVRKKNRYRLEQKNN